MAGIKSIQHGTITIPMGLFSNTAAINNVTVAKAMVIYLGHNQPVTAGWDARVQLANSSSVLAVRANPVSDATTTVGFCVVEFN